MSKILRKAKKKLGQGLATLKKQEKRDIKNLISQKDTNNFIVLHFGVGNENDFATVSSYLENKIKFSKEHFQFGNYYNKSLIKK